MPSSTTWQPITTTQMQPTRDPDSALSLNLSDPWNLGGNSSRPTTTTAAISSQNTNSTTVDQELSDIFGSTPGRDTQMS